MSVYRGKAAFGNRASPVFRRLSLPSPAATFVFHKSYFHFTTHRIIKQDVLSQRSIFTFYSVQPHLTAQASCSLLPYELRKLSSGLRTYHSPGCPLFHGSPIRCRLVWHTTFKVSVVHQRCVCVTQARTFLFGNYFNLSDIHSGSRRQSRTARTRATPHSIR